MPPARPRIGCVEVFFPGGAPCLRARSSRPGQMGSSATPGIPPHPVKSKDSSGWSFFRHTTPSLGRTGTESKSRTDPVSASQPQPAPEGWGRGGDSCSRELQPPRSRGGPQPSLALWAGAGARPCRRARPLWAPRPLPLTWEAGTAAAFGKAAVPRGSSLLSPGGLPPVLAGLRPGTSARRKRQRQGGGWGGSPPHS